MNCIIFYPAVGDQIGCQEINMIFTLVPIVANIIVIIMIMRINIFFMYWLIFSGRELNQNPREASSRSRIFLSKSTWGEQPVIFFNSLVYMSVGWWFVQNLLTKRRTIQTRNLVNTLPSTISCFFKKVTLRAASLEKLPCHMDFPHISSIAWFLFVYVWMYLFVPSLLAKREMIQTWNLVHTFY